MTTVRRDDRKARLAAALRQNLHRRKTAERDAAAKTVPEGGAEQEAGRDR